MMVTITEAPKDIPVLCETDVLVIGGGAAGIGAALGAARSGAKTLLLERFGCLGGCQTLTFNDSFSFVDDRIQGGIIQEIINRLEAGGAIYESSAGSIREYWSRNEGCYYFDGEYYKQMLDEMMIESGVKILYYTFAVDAIKEGNSLKGVVTESMEGRQVIMAKTIIDCTGIADLAWKAGASVIGEEGYPDDRFGPFKGQHMGYGYGYFLRGLDYEKFREFAEKNVEDWDMWVKGKKLFKQAKAENKLYALRNSLIFQEYKNGRVWMLSPGYTLPAGEHPWMVETMTAGTIDMRKQAWSVYELIKNNVPGFEKTKIEQTPSRLMFRDGHRILGEYVLKEDDMRSGKTFDDAVAVCNMPPDLFFPDGSHHFQFDVTPYDIPYRSLLSKSYANLLAAGGAASSDFMTWAAVRYCTPSICTGQAAGTAAALAVRDNISPRDISIPELQQNLAKQGLMTTNRDIPDDVIEEYRRRSEAWGGGFSI